MPLVSDSSELKRRIRGLLKEPYVTIDTEFIRERTYFPQLCLIQIAGKDDAFAIDTMHKDLDIAPFVQLLKNKRILKVFHACEQDMEVMLVNFGFLPEPIFDTQIAAQLLGYGESIGYANLVKQIADVNIDKTSRFTDWAQRPLTERQLDYAISDVTHLRTAYEAIALDLKTRGREEWLLEETEKFLDKNRYVTDPEKAWRRLKTRGVYGASLSVLAALARYREIRARDENVPRSRILRDEALLELAHAIPTRLEEIKKMRSQGAHMQTERAEEILGIITEAKTKQPPAMLKPKPLPGGLEPLIELMKVLLKMKSEEAGVAQSMIATVDDLRVIAAFSKPDVPAMHGWRYEIFGKFALLLKTGKLSMIVENKRVMLVENEA